MNTCGNACSVQSYAQSTGLELVAASFFTVQNGEPTGKMSSNRLARHCRS